MAIVGDPVQQREAERDLRDRMQVVKGHNRTVRARNCRACSGSDARRMREAVTPAHVAFPLLRPRSDPSAPNVD